MTQLHELYRQKGEAQTQIEIWSGRIQAINQQIAQEIGKGNNKPETIELPAGVSPTENEKPTA